MFLNERLNSVKIILLNSTESFKDPNEHFIWENNCVQIVRVILREGKRTIVCGEVDLQGTCSNN